MLLNCGHSGAEAWRKLSKRYARHALFAEQDEERARVEGVVGVARRRRGPADAGVPPPPRHRDVDAHRGEESARP